MAAKKKVTWSETDSRLRAWLHGCKIGDRPEIDGRDWRRLVQLVLRMQRAGRSGSADR